MLIILLSNNLQAVNSRKIAAYGGVTTAIIWGTSIGVKTIHLYIMNRNLQDDKRTWGLSKEILPSFYEIKNAEEDASRILLADVRNFRNKYAKNPYFLLCFVEEAQHDLKVLDSYLEKLKGKSRISELFVDIKNKTVFRCLLKSINNVLEQTLHYRKRLSFIIKILLSTDEYKLQLKHSSKFIY